MNRHTNHQLVWERRQADLWDRVFKVTQDVVTLAETLQDLPGQDVLRRELILAAMQVGTELVRANAAQSARQFRQNIWEAKMKVAEADYWLRLVYVLQKRDRVQRDLSSVIAQYTRVAALLQQLLDHIQGEAQVLQRHTKGASVN